MLTYFGGYQYFDPAYDTETELHVKSFDEQISAIAELVLQSKIECNASGKYAYACGSTWAAAKSFAGAAYEAYAAAWVDVDTGDCNCGIDIYASSDAVVSSFAEIWTQIAARLDDHACAGTGAAQTQCALLAKPHAWGALRASACALASQEACQRTKV